ncbi:MAG: sugar phosphate isomerase/epimerase [Bacillota bacterium]|nr:sugar phosphate isomerase/epimerase [Bacillota bacterium]
MRLGTTTTLFLNNPSGRDISTIECIKRCSAAGFSVLDMNFFPMLSGRTEFVKDNWKEEAYKIRESADEAGMVFSQSHLPYHPNYMKLNPPGDSTFNERFDEYMKRSVEISGILGVKWAVCHPYACTDADSYDNDADIAITHRFYDPILEALKKARVGLAIENIVGMQPPIRRRFTAIADELCELIDSFKDESVGACWDFGHGNQIYKDQKRAIRKVGSRLRATHLNDNRGRTDAHTLPFVSGTTDWEECLPVLSEIDYDGDLVYEVKCGVNLPNQLKDDFATLAVEIGKHCLSLAQKGERA